MSMEVYNTEQEVFERIEANEEKEQLKASITPWQVFEAATENPSLMQNFLKKIDEDTYKVDFSCAPLCENYIGLSDVLWEEVREVYVEWHKEGNEYKMHGIRRGLKGGFYTEEWRYVPIFQDFQVTVLKRASWEELERLQSQYSQEIQAIFHDPKYESFKKEVWEKEFLSMVKLSREYGIDYRLVFSLRKFFSNQYSFGNRNDIVDTFQWKLIMTCRSIQSHMQIFQKITGKSPMEGNYECTPEFLYYFISMYPPLQEHTSKRENNGHSFKEFMMLYSVISWKTFHNVDELFKKFSEEYNQIERQAHTFWLNGKTTPERLIQAVYRHMGKRYQLWGDGRHSIDCSQLVIEGLKDCWVCDQSFDTTAHNLARYFTIPKNPYQVVRWDLVFLMKGERITHVAIALWSPVWNSIPIIDASSNVGRVSIRYQRIHSWVMVGTPTFYA